MPNGDADGILANCDTTVLVSAPNDPQTAGYFALRTGMEVYEVMALRAEEELVLVRGKHARRVRRYDPATHPNHALATLAATASTR